MVDDAGDGVVSVENHHIAGAGVQQIVKGLLGLVAHTGGTGGLAHQGFDAVELPAPVADVANGDGADIMSVLIRDQQRIHASAGHALGALQHAPVPLDGLEVGPHEVFHLGGSGGLRRVLAQEVADQVVGRVLQHFLGRGHLHDLALGHEDDGICQLQRLAHVMADKDDGLAQLLLDVLYLVLEDLTGHGVQGGEGLIHQHDGGRGRQGPQYTDPLLLAAGELGGILVGVLFHAHHLQKVLDDGITLGLVIFQQLGHHADVLGHGHVGEQADLLDHVADVTAQCHLVLAVDILAVDQDGAAVRFDQAVDGLQSGGLAAAGGDRSGPQICPSGMVKVRSFKMGDFP